MKGQLTHVAAMRHKIATVELLCYVKEQHTYRELAQLTGIQDTVLARYVGEHVQPTLERAYQLSHKLLSLADIPGLIASKLERDGDGHYDTTYVIGDPIILRLAAHHALNDFKDKHVAKVVAASVSGIPLATTIAYWFGGLSIVPARAEREAGVPGFIECEYHSEGRSLQSLYMPRDAIRRNDAVLVVDGIIRDHRAVLALTKMLLEKAKAHIVGIFALMATTSEWKTLCAHHPGVVADVMFQANTEAQ